MTAIIDGTNGVTTPNVLTSSSGVALTLQSAGTTAVTIDTSQNVGIGTASPTQKLTVSGSSSLGTASASGNTQIFQAPGSLFLTMNTNGTLSGARRNWAISPESQAAGALCFECGTSEGAVPSSPKLIIRQQGAVVLSGGSTSADGVGITFPATQSASSDANTLDDYEEGTWTPALNPTSGGFGSTTQTGNYTKIGRVVSIYATISVTNVGTASGGLTLSGLPFTSAASNRNVGIVRENGVTGYLGQLYCDSGGTSGAIQLYTGGNFSFATSDNFLINYTYYTS